MVFAIRVDYIIAPLKVLQSLKESVTAPDEKYSFVPRLSRQNAVNYNFTDEEVCYCYLLLYLNLVPVESFDVSQYHLSSTGKHICRSPFLAVLMANQMYLCVPTA